MGVCGSIVTRRLLAVSLVLLVSTVPSVRAQTDDARQRQAAAEAYERACKLDPRHGYRRHPWVQASI